ARTVGGLAVGIVHVAGVDVVQPNLARDLARPRSVAAGVCGRSSILKSGWKAVKCSGTSGPSSAMIHSHIERVSAGASFRPGIIRFVISNHTLVSRLSHLSVSSTGSRCEKVIFL